MLRRTFLSLTLSALTLLIATPDFTAAAERERIRLFSGGKKVTPCMDLAKREFPIELEFSDGSVLEAVAFLGAGGTTCVFRLKDGTALRVRRDRATFISGWVDGHAKIRGKGLRIPELHAADARFHEYAVVEYAPIQFTAGDFALVAKPAFPESARQEFLRSHPEITQRVEAILKDPDALTHLEKTYDEFAISTASFRVIADAFSANVGWTGKEWILIDWYDGVLLAKSANDPTMVDAFSSISPRVSEREWRARMAEAIRERRRCQGLLGSTP